MNNNFYKFVNDSTFKEMIKDKEIGPYFLKFIGRIINRDFSKFKLYDPEINKSNDLKDERLDILFVEDGEIPFQGTTINIEMQQNYNIISKNKSLAYLVRIIDSKYRSGLKYENPDTIQVILIDENDNLDDKRLESGIVHYKLRSEELKYEIDGIDRYEIYLEKYKGLRYNDGIDELYAFFSLLTTDSLEEMLKVLNGSKEEKIFMDKMNKLSTDEKFLGVYSAKEDELKTKNSYISLGEEKKTKDAAINFYKNGASKELIIKSLNITEEKLEEYLKEK